MICRACGYEHEGEWRTGGYFHTKGDVAFIQVYSEHKFKMENPRECEHGDYDYQQYVNVELYACPKCGTVRIEKD